MKTWTTGTRTSYTVRLPTLSALVLEWYTRYIGIHYDAFHQHVHAVVQYLCAAGKQQLLLDGACELEIKLESKLFHCLPDLCSCSLDAFDLLLDGRSFTLLLRPICYTYSTLHSFCIRLASLYYHLNNSRLRHLTHRALAPPKVQGLNVTETCAR